MKKLFVSMGLAAASVASVQLTQAADGSDGANGVDSKVWSVSASLRGFYDDNYNTAPAAPKLAAGVLSFRHKFPPVFPFVKRILVSAMSTVCIITSSAIKLALIRSTKAMMLICGLIMRLPNRGTAKLRTA